MPPLDCEAQGLLAPGAIFYDTSSAPSTDAQWRKLALDLQRIHGVPMGVDDVVSSGALTPPNVAAVSNNNSQTSTPPSRPSPPLTPFENVYAPCAPPPAFPTMLSVPRLAASSPPTTHQRSPPSPPSAPSPPSTPESCAPTTPEVVAAFLSAMASTGGDINSLLVANLFSMLQHAMINPTTTPHASRGVPSAPATAHLSPSTATPPSVVARAPVPHAPVGGSASCHPHHVGTSMGVPSQPQPPTPSRAHIDSSHGARGVGLHQHHGHPPVNANNAHQHPQQRAQRAHHQAPQAHRPAAGPSAFVNTPQPSVPLPPYQQFDDSVAVRMSHTSNGRSHAASTSTVRYGLPHGVIGSVAPTAPHPHVVTTNVTPHFSTPNHTVGPINPPPPPSAPTRTHTQQPPKHQSHHQPGPTPSGVGHHQPSTPPRPHHQPAAVAPSIVAAAEALASTLAPSDVKLLCTLLTSLVSASGTNNMPTVAPDATFRASSGGKGGPSPAVPPSPGCLSPASCAPPNTCTCNPVSHHSHRLQHHVQQHSGHSHSGRSSHNQVQHMHHHQHLPQQQAVLQPPSIGHGSDRPSLPSLQHHIRHSDMRDIATAFLPVQHAVLPHPHPTLYASRPVLSSSAQIPQSPLQGSLSSSSSLTSFSEQSKDNNKPAVFHHNNALLTSLSVFSPLSSTSTITVGAVAPNQSSPPQAGGGSGTGSGTGSSSVGGHSSSPVDLLSSGSSGTIVVPPNIPTTLPPPQPCGHVNTWRRLRNKKGLGHYVCTVCSTRWKMRCVGVPVRPPQPAEPDSPHSANPFMVVPSMIANGAAP